MKENDFYWLRFKLLRLYSLYFLILSYIVFRLDLGLNKKMLKLLTFMVGFWGNIAGGKSAYYRKEKEKQKEIQWGNAS